jgi:CRP/FNR family transcriptional regulator, anaerobic regulatory protein
MNTALLFDYLSELHPISSQFKEALTKELVPLTLPRGYNLLEAPRISDQAFFLLEGSAITYVYQEGRKVVQDIWSSQEIIVSYVSFFEQSPALEFIELVEPSSILCIRYVSVSRMLYSFVEAQKIFELLMIRHYKRCRERVCDFQQLKAWERFDKLIQAHPGIEQLLPQDQIASYLGITPQSLSRIKRERAKR